MEIKTLLCLIPRVHLRCPIDSLRLLCIPISTSIYVMSIMKVRQFVRQVRGQSVLNCLYSGIKFCDELKLDFFKNYTRDKCQQECRYKKIMEKCNCHPPYLPAWMDLPRCTFDQHSVSKTSFKIF